MVVTYLSVVESLDVPEVGLAVKDHPALGTVIRLLVEQLLQVGHAGAGVQVQETQVHLPTKLILQICTFSTFFI